MKNPRFLEIDNIYYSGLIIVDYYREYTDLILKELIKSDININISLFYEKQNSYKTVKDLTYFIGNIGVDVKEKNENREDIEIASFTYNDAKYIRREIQINNQELYYIYLYITVFSKSERETEYLLEKLEGILEANGLVSKRANFREEQIYLACNLFCENSEEIKAVSRRNILTDGIVSTYPFISNSIFDKNGIYIGNNLYDNSLIFINRFDEKKYKNSNICILGTSGAGKSFFNKLLILRSRIMGIEQYVIDPEREYNILAEHLEGSLIKLGPSSNTYINILDIREESLEDEEKGYLLTKLNKLKGFFKLIINISDEIWSVFEEQLIKTYEEKGINFNDNSLYKDNNKFSLVPIFKTSEEMPKLEDLYNNIKDIDILKNITLKLYPFVYGSLKFFNEYTNVELDNKFIVADIYDLKEENLKYGMYLFTDLFWDKIKKDRNVKKSIYLDEVWKLIGDAFNKEVANFVYKIFKTIRKYGGSAVSITQDISDLFNLEDGTFGKSILNNSNFKFFFNLEEENILLLDKYTNITLKEKIEIKNLKIGEVLIWAGENHFLFKVDYSEYEKNLIEKIKERGDLK